MNGNDTKILVEAAINIQKSKVNVNAGIKEIEKQANKIQTEVVVDTKSAQQAWKQQEEIFKKSENSRLKVANLQSKSNRNTELKQAQAINKALDEEYKLKLKNAEIIKKTKVSNVNNINSQQSEYWNGRFKDNISNMNKTPDGVSKLNSYYKELEKSSLQLQTQKDNFNKKNLNSIDVEIAKRKLQSDQFSQQLKSQMQEKQKQDEQYNTYLNNLSKEYEARDQRVINAKNNNLKNAQSRGKQSVSNENLKLDKDKLTSNIQSYMQNNSRVTKVFGGELNGIIEKLKTADKAQFGNLNKEFQKVKANANQAGLTADTFGDKFKKNLGQLTNFLTVSTVVVGSIRTIQKMVTNVIELDTAMYSLKKVTDETDESYEKFFSNATQSAKKYGSTITDIVQSSADFARLGYSMQDALSLAENASIYSNVGEISIDQGSESIISTMKAFNVEAKDSIQIIDKFNEVNFLPLCA